MSCKIYTRNIYGRNGDMRLPINLRFKNADGSVKDISSYNFVIQVKDKEGIVVAETATNSSVQLIINLSRVDNNTISWGFGSVLNMAPNVYRYAIKMIDNNQPTTIIQGDFIVEPQLVDTILN